jgi:hypothetical protein
MSIEEDLNVVAIPEQEVTMKTVTQWYEAVRLLNNAKSLEMALRKRIFGKHFPNPVEGVNEIEMPYGPPGYIMKGTYKLDRKVDEAIAKALAPKFEEAKIPVAELIKLKPELSVSEYRKLQAAAEVGEEGKARLVLFEQCLIIKPGAPELKIVEKK